MFAKTYQILRTIYFDYRQSVRVDLIQMTMLSLLQMKIDMKKSSVCYEE